MCHILGRNFISFPHIITHSLSRIFNQTTNHSQLFFNFPYLFKSSRNISLRYDWPADFIDFNLQILSLGQTVPESQENEKTLLCFDKDQSQEVKIWPFPYFVFITGGRSGSGFKMTSDPDSIRHWGSNVVSYVSEQRHLVFTVKKTKSVISRHWHWGLMKWSVISGNWHWGAVQ